jgi:hypothetical protein
MKRNRLLQLSAFFALITFAGHTIGALSDHSKGSAAIEATYKMMQETYIQFPFGISRNIVTLMSGANFCLSVYLLVAGLILLALSFNSSENRKTDNLVLIINATGLGVTAVISGFFFFVMPAVCLGLAAAISLAATRAIS